METPIFRLPGIIREKEDNSDFEGPLTLILQLLSRDKVQIRDISISLILKQYLDYLDEMAELNLDIASEFVAMASHLMYIKTKMLLSDGEEITELEQLIISLEELQRNDIYLQIKEVAQTLSDMYARREIMMAGPPEYYETGKNYEYVHMGEELLEAIYRVVGKENLRYASINTAEPAFPERLTYPINEKISEVIVKLKTTSDMKIVELFHGCKSRTELIATLVAVLELCRVGSILITGDGEDMKMCYTQTGREGEISDFTAED